MDPTQQIIEVVHGGTALGALVIIMIAIVAGGALVAAAFLAGDR